MAVPTDFLLLALFLVGGGRGGGGVGGLVVVVVVLGPVRLFPVSSGPEGEVVVGGMSSFSSGNVVGFCVIVGGGVGFDPVLGWAGGLDPVIGLAGVFVIFGFPGGGSECSCTIISHLRFF